MNKRVLFKHGKWSFLQDFQRSLRGQRNEWDMAFVGGSMEALKMVDEKKFDVIATDIRPSWTGQPVETPIATGYQE